MKRVTLQYLTLPHYRRSLFERLWKYPEINFSVVCGKVSPYTNLKNFEPDKDQKVTFIKNNFIKIGSRKFVWQKGVFKAVMDYTPNYLILLGFDPHILSNIPLFILAKRKKIKVLWWGHATYGKQGFIGRLIRYFFYTMADGILTYDERGRQRLVNIGVDERKIFPIWNCLNDEDYPFKNSKSKINKKLKYNIIFTGRITDRKKIDQLIKAVAILLKETKNIQLHIVGEGPAQQKLKELTQQLNIEKYVVFHGPLYGEELSNLFVDIDLMVIPGLAGLSVIHALAHGIPVLNNNNKRTHPPEVSAIIPGKTGDFFKEDDVQSLAKKIQEWLPKKPQVSHYCQELVQQRYTPDKVSQKIVEALNKI
ncbi:glycosyl transferase group 1 [Caldithrix abyssi DSM 13497]|uniref:Glycosyl transferase group 1 n=1 Tax=Caldithrix abyssi DSM 13497 TaxID=880073 RepID=H1XWL2_CALAY|nr:glycosyltransferase family 4 protein [Caldithrix abyssi]APF17774.1 Glycosyltransferase involved in cell wall bisynthesis [Caldithrix abyssi DSM 13497]EHO41850.1 glycosyl transferase group 1 [Caldithrix abyssi DSM 13497]